MPLRSPVTVIVLVLLLYLAAVLASNDGDPLAFVRIGTRYSRNDPAGSQGYDGQFVYYIARHPAPRTVAGMLDNPPYRYQRILLPLLARGLSFGNPAALPWVLVAIGVISHAAGTWVVARLLAGYNVSRWYALVYGLWPGFLLAVRLDLPEPLAYALIGAAILIEKPRPWLGWVLYGLAAFAKEVALLFVAAQLLVYLRERRLREAAGLFGVGVLPFLVFQGWLWVVFGRLGIGSGGAMATGFEIVPFMGLLRVGAFSLGLLAVFALVYVPSVYFPALWGVWVSARRWLRGQTGLANAALLVNGLVIPFLPFSTVREPGGMFRFVGGLVLAVLLYAGRYRRRRVLRLSVFWLFLNAFVVAEWVG